MKRQKAETKIRRGVVARLAGAGVPLESICEITAVAPNAIRNDLALIQSGDAGDDIKEAYFASRRKHQGKADELVGKLLNNIDRELTEGHSKIVGLADGKVVRATEQVPAKDLAAVLRAVGPVALGMKSEDAPTPVGTFDVKARLSAADMALVMRELRSTATGGNSRTLQMPQESSVPDLEEPDGKHESI